jgi:uncharacterized protein YpmB
MEDQTPHAQRHAVVPENRRKKRFPLVPVIITIIILALAGATTYFFLQYTQLKNNPQAATEQQTQELVEKVGKLITLPSDETPTIATVEDKSKLANQAFFAQAENGDQLLIYTKAQKAVIYRPSQNKIINVGPVSIDGSQEGTQQP